jgi:hypothetical protein
MNSPLARAARFFGYAFIGIVVLKAARLILDPASEPVERILTITVSVLLVYWFAEPLLWNRTMRAQATLRPPSRNSASDQPTSVVPYEVTEQEWVHAKLLYRGAHTVTGVARQIALTLPSALLLYVPLVWITPRWARYDFLRDPRGAAFIIVALAATLVLMETFYRAPLMAAQTFHAKAPLWWPAEIAWNADAIFIKNKEGRFRYAFPACRAWKEDASMILLHSGDNRYWCFPKRALDAVSRLAEFRQLLQDHVPKISPYRVIYRQFRFRG